MNKKCPNCKLVNFSKAETCARCEADLIEVSSEIQQNETPLIRKILKRAAVCFAVCLFTISGFYFSLLVTAKRLNFDEKTKVKDAIKVLEEKGFESEVFLMNYLTAFRANDHWLNASVEKEGAYAATNFPVEIMTVYPDFFQYPLDDTERAAILLHEAQHLKGADEPEAYEFVWKNRQKLGWTKDKYANSIVWRNVRKQTREAAPHLFVCELKEFADCTE
ncbi:MAG TPA: hypothetical protein PKE69_08815 [Pyrinomonadaceae bacterium]|nr:hypothetical protein [Pyrinomonadaceae bacterium]